MQKSLSTLIQESKEDILGLIRSKQQLWTLTAIEKGVPVGLKVGYGAVMAFLAIYLFSFLLLAGAFAFSLIFVDESALIALRSITFGILCLSGVLLILILILLAFRKAFLRRTTQKIVGSYLDQLDEKERQASEQALLEDDTKTIDEDIDIKDEEGDIIKPIIYDEQ